VKKCLSAMIGIFLTINLSACGNGSSNNGNNSTSAGDAETIFNQKCSSCHGQNLEGNVGPSLKHAGSDLSEKEILTIIEKGKSGDKGGMPGGLIKGDDAKKVAKWLSDKK